MKNARQKEIMDIIRQYTVSNQDALQELLKKRGYPVTQATISRDIRELGLIKKADGEGIYHYVMPDRAAPYGDMLTGNVLSADYAGHTLVIKCRSGTAQADCSGAVALRHRHPAQERAGGARQGRVQGFQNRTL